MGFWTAPSRASAATSTIDSIHVGSSHDTLTSPLMPWDWSPAAAVSAALRYSRNVIVRPVSSTAMTASGDASARRSINSHNVLACNMLALLFMPRSRPSVALRSVAAATPEGPPPAALAAANPPPCGHPALRPRTRSPELIGVDIGPRHSGTERRRPQQPGLTTGVEG